MTKPRAGVLVFGESLVREDVYRKRKPIAEREVRRFISSLEDKVVILRPHADEVRTKHQALQAVQELETERVDAVVLYLPVFVAPALVAHTASLLKIPVALACNEAADSLSQLAFLAVGGALDQIGLDYLRVPGEATEKSNQEVLLTFLAAAAVKNRLRGQTFGCLGGRSLGISTGTADPSIWEGHFGVDIEHVDQFEVVQRAEKQRSEAVAKHVRWLEDQSASVAFGHNFTAGHLEKQVRCYLATREIVRDYELDFLGIKCQPELSNHYCLQCVNVALCNDPYDAEGSKEPLVCSCEADADGALTMQVLKLISGGFPTNLNDIAWMSAKEMTLANCGSMASYFAGFSFQSEQNMANLHLVAHSFGEAGGACTMFTVPGGRFMTFARLFRRRSQYTLGVLTGTTVEKARERQSPTIGTRPLIFLEMNVEKDRFLRTFGSNHIHGVEGDFKKELESFASLMSIDFIDYDCCGQR